MNKPLTRQQVKALPAGLTITRAPITRIEFKTGQNYQIHDFESNRRERRFESGNGYNNRQLTKGRKHYRSNNLKSLLP